jgi:rhodanese-related sulfurtransferase
MGSSPTLPLEISIQDVHALREAGGPVFLLDCREEEEFAIAKIHDAVLVPMSQFVERLEPHREQIGDMPLVVYCHHGGRSLRVAQWLRGQGFPQAQSMRGGIDAWAQEIEPDMPRY